MSVKSVVSALLAALITLTMVADNASAQRRDRDRGDRDWELLGTETVNFRRDNDVIEVGRREGRFEALRIAVEDGDVQIREMTVVYGNGDRQRFEVDGVIRAGQRSRPIDLKGNERFIKQIELRYRSVGRPGRGDERAKVSIFGKEAGRRHARDDWELLGTEKVDFRRDRDIIRVGRKEGRFEALRLAVKDGDVQVREMTVVYGNGDKQRFEVDGIIREGEQTRPIDLKGNTRFIKEIEFRYKSVGRPRRGDERATVMVYGKEADRRGARRGDDRRRRGFGRPEWVELGCRTVALFGADRDTIGVGRRDGRFKAIKFSAEGQKIYLISAKVVYSNGRPDTLEVAKTIPKNGETKPIAVRGRTRSIDRIEIVSAKRPSLKRVKICAHGLQ